MHVVRVLLGASGLIFALYQLMGIAVGCMNEVYADPSGGRTRLLMHAAAMGTGLVVALLCVFCPKPRQAYMDDALPVESSAPRPYF